MKPLPKAKAPALSLAEKALVLPVPDTGRNPAIAPKKTKQPIARPADQAEQSEEVSSVEVQDNAREGTASFDGPPPIGDPMPVFLAQAAPVDPGSWHFASEPVQDALSKDIPVSASTSVPPSLSMVPLGAAGMIAAGAMGATANTPVIDITAPRAQSLTAEALTKTLTITYNEPLKASQLPAASAFQVTTAGVANAVDSVSVNGNSLILHLVNAFNPGSTVSITYTDPSPANDTNAVQDEAGNDAAGFVQGVVADGYIRGAQIYIDTNNNGVPDASELQPGVTTDANGHFFLPSTAPIGPLIAVGGTNIDTGLPQLTPIKAPAGAVAVNPLTHLTQAVMEASALSGAPLSASTASALVTTALGIQLPAGSSLLSVNPLGGSMSDGYSLAAQKAASKIASFTLLSALGNQADAFSAMDSLAGLILRNPNTPVDLTDANTIDGLLGEFQKNTPTIIADIVRTNTAIAQASQFSQIAGIQTEQLSDASQFAQQNAQALSASVGAVNATPTPPPTTTLFYEADASINQQDVAKGYTDIQGTTQPFASVYLQLCAGERRNFNADKNGQWVYKLNSADIAAMGQGLHTLRGWTTGPAGERSVVTELPLRIDTEAPAAFTPVLTTSTDKTKPIFQFSAEAGATLRVADGSGLYQSLGTGTGTSQDHRVSLINYQGSHQLNFEAIDPSGNTQKVTYTYWLDSVAPQVSITPANDVLTDGESTTISFTFEQAPTSFSINDIQVTGGTLSQLNGTGLTRTAVLTVDTDPATTDATIRIASGLLVDSAGNSSNAVSGKVMVNTALPTTLPHLPASSDAQFTEHLATINNSLISAVGRMLSAELGKMHFLADLTQVASYIQSHLSITWNTTDNTFGVAFQDSSTLFSAPLAANLGVEGLNLSLQTRKNLDLTLSCNVNLSGGYNPAYGGLYLDISGTTPCLSITASAQLPDDFAVSGTLGPLNINAINQKTDARVSASLSLTNQETPFTYEDIVQYCLYRIQPNAANQGRLTSAQIDSLKRIDNNPDYDSLGLFTPSYLLYNTPGFITDEINGFFSSRDNRITWQELSDAALNPSTIGTIVSADINASENLAFSVKSTVTTGLGVVDALIPNFSFDVTASGQQLGDINRANLSYTLDAAITQTKISSDVLTNLVAPTLQEAQKLLTPVYGLVDFFHSPLPWKVQTYQSTVPKPSGFGILNPVAWYDYTKGAVKEGLSAELDGLIRSFYGALDVNQNGQIEVIETLQGPVQLAQSVLQLGQSAIDEVQVILQTFKDSPVSTVANWTLSGTVIGGLAVGGVISGAVATVIAASVDTLIAKTNALETQLTSLQTNMSSLNDAMTAFDQFLYKLEDIRTMTNTLTANQANQHGITMDGIALGNYGYHLSGQAGEVTVTEGIPSSNTTLNALVQSPPTTTNNTTPAYQGIVDELQSIGVQLPVLTDQNVLGKILTLQPVDLLTFDPNLPSVDLDFTTDVDFIALGQDIANLIELVGVPGLGASYSTLAKTVGLFASLNSQFLGSLSIDSNLDFGVDTAGLNRWFLAGMPLDLSGLQHLADGFYASDHLSTTNGVTTDLPELTLQASLGLHNNLTLGSGFFGGNLDLTNSLEGKLLLDIADPTNDGKLRWSEIVDSLQNDKNLLAVDPLSALNLVTSGTLGGWLDFNKPIVSAETLKGLGLNTTAVTAIQKTLEWFATAAENKYSWEIPFSSQLNLVGTTADAIFPV